MTYSGVVMAVWVGALLGTLVALVLAWRGVARVGAAAALVADDLTVTAVVRRDTAHLTPTTAATFRGRTELRDE